MKKISKIVGLIVVILTFFSVIGVVDIPSFVRTSWAQYNVAPPICTPKSQLPAWDGANWVCATPVLGVAVVPFTSTQTAKQTLLTQTLPAGYLSADANCVRIVAWGTCLNNGDQKTQTIDFGATTVSTTGAINNNNQAWYVEAIVCRTGASTQAALGRAQSDAGNPVLLSTTPAENTANAIVINITATTANHVNNTTARGLVVERVN